MNTDSLSWLAKALGKTKQARYTGILDYCLAKTTDKKVLGHMTEAKASLEGTTASPFEGGKMDLVQMRAQATKKAVTASTRDQTAKSFEKLRAGLSLDEVYSTLGVPNEVKGANVVRDKKAGHLYVKVETSDYKVEFSYNGIGKIHFAYADDKSKWLLNEARSDKGLIWTRGGGRFVTTTNELISLGDSAELYDMARRLLDQSMAERVTLDRIADRLSQSRDEMDPKRADVLAWLSKVIAKSRDGRYRPLMLELSSTAAHNTLKKYAALAASNLPETTEEVYVPTFPQ